MKKLIAVAALSAAVSVLAASEEFVQVPTAEKVKDEGLMFLATFDGHNAKADFAKGSPDSFAAKDVDLGLRGLIGFDRQSAYPSIPGEELRFPGRGNFDPHKGTVSFWMQGIDYNPSDAETDGKKRGNVILARFVASDGGERETDYKIYEFADQLYFDWLTTPNKNKWGQGARAHAVRKSCKKGEWHQIVGTWDDDRIKLYIDGELADEGKINAAERNTADLMPGDAPHSYVGIRSFEWDDKHAWGVGVDDFAVYDRAMTALEIRNRYLKLLKNPGNRKVQPYDVVLNGVVTCAADKLDRLEAEFTFSEKPQGALDWTLTAPDGTVRKGSWTFAEKHEMRILGGIVASGKWKLETKMSGKDAVVAEIEKPDMPWLGNGLGDEDEVPALWKDFAVDGRTVRLWNRTYVFGAGPLPEKIVAFGKDLLAQRPRLLVNGREPSWTAGKTSRTNRAVVYAGEGRVGDVRLSYATTVEYDGFVKFDWTVLGTPKVDSMSIDWQVADANHHYLMTPKLCQEKGDQLKFPFPKVSSNPKMLWFVTERKGGFAFMSRNDANWVHDEDAPIYFVDRRTGKCRVEMIQKATTLPKDCDYQALFIATPTRPLPERNRAIRYTGPGGISLSHAGGNGYLNSAFTHAPMTDGSFERRYANARSNSVSVYGGVKSLTDQEPETDYLFKYWERPGASTYTMGLWREPEKGRKFKISTSSRSACPSTVYTDYVVWCDWKLWTHPLQDRFWQTYFDLCGVGFCQNVHHGCRYRDRFGRWVSTLDVLPTRKMIQRIVALAHRYGKTVILHGQRDYLPFAMGLADYWFPGEQYGALMHRNLYGYTDEVPDDIVNSEFNRNVLGIGVIHLPAIGQALKSYGAKENWKYTWGMLAKLQLHDVETGELWASGKPVRKVWDILENYRCDDKSTVCHLYYDQTEVTSSDPAVRITWYDCPENRKLLVLSNCDSQPHVTAVDASALKVPDLAYDEIMNRPVPVKDGRFAVIVPARALLMIALPPKEPKGGRQLTDVKPEIGEFAADGANNAWGFDQMDAKTFGNWKSDGAKISFGHRASEGHAAAGALSVAVEEGNPPKKSGCYTARFPAKPGKEYTCVVWVKAKGLADETDLGLAFQGQDEKTHFLGTAPVSTHVKAVDCRDGWKRVVLTFTVPTEGRWAKCANLLVTFGASGTVPGEALFDDFSFR